MGLITYAKQLSQDFTSVIFPDICIHCSETLYRNEQYLCTSCQLQVQYIYPVQPIDKYLLKFVGFRSVAYVIPYMKFTKKGVVQSLLHELKYKGNTDIGNYLGASFAEKLSGLPKSDFLLPVPTTEEKRISRGYNQTEVIATAIADKLDCPVKNDVIFRIHKSLSQTGKSRINRWVDIRNQFVYRQDAESIRGMSVLVVDDVLTTGATVGAICEILENQGVRTIGILTLASGQ